MKTWAIKHKGLYYNSHTARWNRDLACAALFRTRQLAREAIPKILYGQRGAKPVKVLITDLPKELKERIDFALKDFPQHEDSACDCIYCVLFDVRAEFEKQGLAKKK